MRAPLLAAVLLLHGCSHDLGQLFGPEAKTREAHALLAAGNFEEARELYRQIVVDAPTWPDALMGLVFTDLVLVSQSPPAKALSDLCHQPTLDVAGLFLGPSGLVAQSAQTRAGTADLEVLYFPGTQGSAVNLDVAFDDVRARIEPPYPGRPESRVILTLREREVVEQRWMFLSVNPDDMIVGDEVATPMTVGAAAPIEQLAGFVEFIEFDRPGVLSSLTPSGTLRAHSSGYEVGAPIELEFDQVRVPAYQENPCGGCGAAWYAINGRISDIVSPELELDTTRVPFAALESDNGTPRRDVDVVAIDGCERLDDRDLASRAQAVTALLAADAEHLRVLLASPDRDRFSFVVPEELFSASRDVAMNLTDVRVLRGLLLTGGALADIVAEYRWLAGDLQSQVEDQPWNYDEEPPVVRSRVLWPATLAVNLEAGFLTRPPEFDLEPMRGRLRDGLGELADALRETPTAPGMFDFAARSSGRVIAEVAGALGALRDSIDSAEPVGLPESPHHRFHLARLFSDPLDAARLRELTQLTRLWTVHDGDPTAPYAPDRNPEVGFELDVVDVRTWSNGIVNYPPLESAMTCGPSESCPDGYRCDMPTCELIQPWFTTEEAWKSASRGDWPVFVSDAVREVLAVD